MPRNDTPNRASELGQVPIRDDLNGTSENSVSELSCRIEAGNSRRSAATILVGHRLMTIPRQ